MTDDELLPCPFCGGLAEMNDNLVSCSYCLCSVPNGFGYEGNTLGYDTEAEAIAAWNRRSLDPAKIRVKQLEAALELIANTDPDDGTAWFHNVANKALKG